MKILNWGIIGTGVIANAMAETLLSYHGRIYGVCSKHRKNALEFAKKHKVTHTFDNIDALLDDDNIDIVYIATPHNLHYEAIMKTLEHRKHVLCEKAITVTYKELKNAYELASSKDLILMEAMTIFHMPLYKKVKELIEDGIIGKVKLVQVNFGSCKEYDVTNRFFSKELAGGALLDIGVYAASFARFFLSEQPEELHTTVNYFETGVDEQSGIVLKNKAGELATITLAMRAKMPKRGIIAGELGYIEINNYPRANQATITYTSDGHEEVIEVGNSDKALLYEVQDMEAFVFKTQGHKTIALSLDVMDILDKIRCRWESLS